VKKRLEDIHIHWVDNFNMDEEQIGMDWICLVEDTDQWQAVVSHAVNCRVQ
jgi:hypothetical protein